MKSIASERRHVAPSPGSGDYRTPGQHDRDRLLYSSAFRRLAEVTQVVSANSGYIFHNRLTHSLQVAQVGRRIAENLLAPAAKPDPLLQERLDPDVVEAAALAHDLGHPPFGHVIEEELNHLSRAFGGFEGNAQSFRVITKLAFHRPTYSGLNLSRRTLAATLKYPWFQGENSKKLAKWGAFRSESDDFAFARDKQLPQTKTLEASLMDWADDITYCVHDLEDFYRAGRIPLHLIASSTDNSERTYFFENVFRRHLELGFTEVVQRQSQLEQAFTELLSLLFAPTQPYRGIEQQRAGLRSFTASLISRYASNTKIDYSGDIPKLKVSSQLRDEVLMLKQLTWTYVIEAPSLATQQHGQRRIVRELFEIFSNASSHRADWQIFPIYFRDKLERACGDDERLRICTDLIAGMTEVQVHQLHARLTGRAFESSLFDPFG